MASVVPSDSKYSPTYPNTLKQEDEDEYADQHTITSRLYLKSSESAGKLEKDHVVRRIRHRRRMNKARSFLHMLLGSPSGGGERVSAHEKKWLDDAFSAP